MLEVALLGPVLTLPKKGAALTHTVNSSTSAQNASKVTIANSTVGIDSFYPLPKQIISPIRVEVLSQYTMEHPDRELVNFLINGFKDGFDIMYVGSITPTTPKNLKSARDNPEEVTQAITTEISRGHTSGPFTVSPFAVAHCSPLGAVQKDPCSPKIRLILDLSQPSGESINEGIIDEFCSVKYTSWHSSGHG